MRMKKDGRAKRYNRGEINMTNPLIQIVDHQLEYNGRKSLFYEVSADSYLVEPSNKTVQFLKDEFETIKQAISTPGSRSIHQAVCYMTRRAIESFIEANQFLNFTQHDYEELKKVYYTSLAHLSSQIIEGKNRTVKKSENCSTSITEG